ncbi:MAG TPA: sigma-70 family RNA polymerase sigma factor [Haliscomenobacter sp.]|uniref:RNA polymerase sigma factor n=1 Tax=Haliscomenobacter sp. TaxID=2717303 RepID=UPI002C68495E|nr:sigma-70 family RNA polymerase sigma factor [Haliscomenobacter sp.]HOY18596.1 sigma-70 family RNA polymerase sigma factor [Haliscomenobacter sp.]HPH19288.1 sigma-70 family RNA polymerase sigma factor [Haliscomenobacter sp.]
MTTTLLQKLMEGDETALEQAYLDYRSDFLQWASTNSSQSTTELADLYQDTLIIFYQNLRAGKILHLDRGIAPYLFGIGKKLLLRRYAAQAKRELSFDPADEVFLQGITLPEENKEVDHGQMVLRKALEQLNETCQQIIEWFYYHDYSIEMICQRLGYSSEEVTRVTKMRCLKKLRELMTKTAH